MKIISIATSKKKGTQKVTVDEAFLKKEHGLEGDAHAGAWHRQVSFLASEEIDKAREKGLEVTFGDFAENIATTGVDWKNLLKLPRSAKSATTGAPFIIKPAIASCRGKVFLRGCWRRAKFNAVIRSASRNTPTHNTHPIQILAFTLPAA
jgi:hypothetical protein